MLSIFTYFAGQMFFRVSDTQKAQSCKGTKAQSINYQILISSIFYKGEFCSSIKLILCVNILSLTIPLGEVYSTKTRLTTLKLGALTSIKNIPPDSSFKSKVFLESNFGTVYSFIKKPLKS